MSNQNRLIIVANEKGGVGKTTLSLAIIDKMALDGIAPSVIQVDRQQRLSAALDGAVLTIESDPKAQRQEPTLEIRRFSPILAHVELMANQSSVLIDIGAGEASRFAEWASLVDLEEDIAEWGLRCDVLIPYLSESESIRQASWTADRLRTALPDARISFIENQRDGQIAHLHPGSDAATSFAEKLLPWLSDGAISLTVPGIPAGAWRHFESANCRFSDVVVMSTNDAMLRTGLSRAESKIARGDVSQWLLQVFDELDRLFGMAGD